MKRGGGRGVDECGERMRVRGGCVRQRVRALFQGVIEKGECDGNVNNLGAVT